MRATTLASNVRAPPPPSKASRSSRARSSALRMRSMLEAKPSQHGEPQDIERYQQEMYGHEHCAYTRKGARPRVAYVSPMLALLGLSDDAGNRRPAAAPSAVPAYLELRERRHRAYRAINVAPAPPPRLRTNPATSIRSRGGLIRLLRRKRRLDHGEALTLVLQLEIFRHLRLRLLRTDS